MHGDAGRAKHLKHISWLVCEHVRIRDTTLSKEVGKRIMKLLPHKIKHCSNECALLF